jgi:hypothetical protein
MVVSFIEGLVSEVKNIIIFDNPYDSSKLRSALNWPNQHGCAKEHQSF